MTTKTDTYNYTQNPLGGGQYTTIGSNGLQSTTSGANASSVSTECFSAWSTSNYTFLNDQTSEVTITPVNGDYPGVCIRLTNTSGGQGYVMYYIPEIQTLELYKIVAGVGGVGGNLLGQSNSTSISTGGKMKLGAVGTTLTAYINGVSQFNVTDSTYSSGQPGPGYSWQNSNASLITAWTGTDSGSVVVGPPMSSRGVFVGA